MSSRYIRNEWSVWSIAVYDRLAPASHMIDRDYRTAVNRISAPQTLCQYDIHSHLHALPSICLSRFRNGHFNNVRAPRLANRTDPPNSAKSGHF